MFRSTIRTIAARKCCLGTSAAALALLLFAGCVSSGERVFAIKATVSGLAGSGLELWMNGHDPVTATDDGEVTVAYMVTGYHYSVTVKTQPSNPAQTCTVANAVGVMGSADVTNVTVTCATTYAIVGTVSGLDGTGLVLHSSLGDDLAITANGTFVFPTRAAVGAEYVVTVKTQPTPNPPKTSETCSVGSAYGTVRNADVMNVTVVCSTDAFKVGGAATGLATGTTVVLQNNGTDDLAITATGGFTFATAVASGATYAVTVKAQPTNPWQTCTITNGTGTIAGSAVSNVGVSCMVNRYAIVVNVNGLVGTGLVLQNNGINDLAVTANGNSAFSTHFESGATYSVTVKTHPSSPAQSCTVTNGSGTVEGADVANVAVTCHSWGVAQLIETGADGASSPQIAMNSAGDGIAVWSQSGNIWANRYVAGSGWGTAQLIETNNAGNASYPQVAVDSAGNAVTVWYQSDGTRNNIWANRYVAGSGWGLAQLIETDDASYAWNPQVAMDGSGNAIAVWHQSDGTRYNVWSNRYAVGSGWAGAQLIETGADGASFPQIAMNSAGDGIAVWSQSSSIWANRYVAENGWGTAQLIGTKGAGAAETPQVAMNSSGDAIAVWLKFDGTRYNIWANCYVAGNEWSTAELIETNSASDAWVPRVAIDSSGTAITVWSQSGNIWANRYVAGSGWGTAQLIETDNAGGAGWPQVAVDSAGNAIAVWEQSDGTRGNIWANRYMAGSEWGLAQLIETETGGADRPQVATNGSGKAIAVWHQHDGTRQNIWANQY